MDKHIHPLVEAVVSILAGLAPAALGAAVSLAYEKGLTWAERFIQFAVGVCVSWFASRAIGAITTLDPFVMQGVTFTLGMIAFKAVPRFIAAAVEAVADLPSRFFPKRKDD